MLPFNAVLGNGFGMNIVKRDALFDGWEKLLDRDATMPRLRDANGRPLRLLGEITLLIRFGNTTYRVPFIVADMLAVNAIIGTRFMNRYVDAIECGTQTVRLFRYLYSPERTNGTRIRNTKTNKFEMKRRNEVKETMTLRLTVRIQYDSRNTKRFRPCPRCRFRSLRRRPGSYISNRYNPFKRDNTYERLTELSKYDPEYDSISY